ncbi:hypothetical protein HK102_010069 [Quaeritorhiza haematococci]|nr:hypothetical protein HK102_010069 [Quaeritorhiza haematococci]
MTAPPVLTSATVTAMTTSTPKASPPRSRSTSPVKLVSNLTVLLGGRRKSVPGLQAPLEHQKHHSVPHLQLLEVDGRVDSERKLKHTSQQVLSESNLTSKNSVESLLPNGRVADGSTRPTCSINLIHASKSKSLDHTDDVGEGREYGVEDGVHVVPHPHIERPQFSSSYDHETASSEAPSLRTKSSGALLSDDLLSSSPGETPAKPASSSTPKSKHTGLKLSLHRIRSPKHRSSATDLLSPAGSVTPFSSHGYGDDESRTDTSDSASSTPLGSSPNLPIESTNHIHHYKSRIRSLTTFNSRSTGDIMHLSSPDKHLPSSPLTATTLSPPSASSSLGKAPPRYPSVMTRHSSTSHALCSSSNSPTPVLSRRSSSLAAGDGVPVKETHTMVRDYDPQTGNKMINHYMIIREVGRGVHGKVKLCFDVETGEHWAIKIVEKHARRRFQSRLLSQRLAEKRQEGSAGSPGPPPNPHLEKIKREIAILKKCDHPHVVRLKEVIDDPQSEKIYLVLEYLAGGDIRWHDDSDPPSPIIPIDQARRIFRDVIAGVQYLHYQGIVHRDIKPANLLWTADGRVKISDFGVSVFVGRKRGSRRLRTPDDPNASDGDAIDDHPDEDDDLEGNELELAKTAGSPAFFAPELCAIGDDDRELFMSFSNAVENGAMDAAKFSSPSSVDLNSPRSPPSRLPSEDSWRNWGSPVMQSRSHQSMDAEAVECQVSNGPETPSGVHESHPIPLDAAAEILARHRSTTNEHPATLERTSSDLGSHGTSSTSSFKSLFSKRGLSPVKVKTDHTHERASSQERAAAVTGNYDIHYRSKTLSMAQSPTSNSIPSSPKIPLPGAQNFPHAVESSGKESASHEFALPGFLSPRSRPSSPPSSSVALSGVPLSPTPTPSNVQPPVGNAIDIWAMGVTLYCFVFGKVPFIADTEFELFNVISRQPIRFPEDKPISDDLRDLFLKILEKDPTKRITLEEMKLHPWITSDMTSEERETWLRETDPLTQYGEPMQVTDEEVRGAVKILNRIRNRIRKLSNSFHNLAAGLSGLRRRTKSVSNVIDDTPGSTTSHEPSSASTSPTKKEKKHRKAKSPSKPSSQSGSTKHPYTVATTPSPPPLGPSNRSSEVSRSPRHSTSSQRQLGREGSGNLLVGDNSFSPSLASPIPVAMPRPFSFLHRNSQTHHHTHQTPDEDETRNAEGVTNRTTDPMYGSQLVDGAEEYEDHQQHGPSDNSQAVGDRHEQDDMFNSDDEDNHADGRNKRDNQGQSWSQSLGNGDTNWKGAWHRQSSHEENEVHEDLYSEVADEEDEILAERERVRQWAELYGTGGSGVGDGDGGQDGDNHQDDSPVVVVVDDVDGHGHEHE